MKYTDKKAEAAWLLAVEHNRAIQSVGTPSKGGLGSIYQGLVRVSRAHLIVAGEMQLLSAVKPGHEYLCWVVEDERGHAMITRSEDVDAKGYQERIDGLVAEFEAAAKFYRDDEPVDFGDFGVVSD